MSTTKWYVVQVQSGKDLAMCQVIEGLCAEADQRRQAALAAEAEAAAATDPDADPEPPAPEPLLDEVFSPRFRTQHKRRGQWVDVEHALLPGYVIAVTPDPEELDRTLTRTPDFARVLRFGETYVPLSQEERLWIDKQTKKGDRVVPMSFGYKRGDKLVVTEGPLVNHEWMVDRVSRSKSLANLELHVGQMAFKTTVGLGIVSCEGTDE